MEEKAYIEEVADSPKTSGMETAAHIVSMVFNPFWIPLLAFVLLFSFTYLRIMPLQFKVFVLSLVASFTILAPSLFIYIYKRMNGWQLQDLSQRKRRFIPYLLTSMSYMACLLTMYKLYFPHYFSGIITATLLCMILCMVFNLKWKVSTHTASCGLLISGLLSYSMLFYFNPLWWLSGFILLSGITGTARMILGQQTFLEVVAGFVIGMFCGFMGILFI